MGALYAGALRSGDPLEVVYPDGRRETVPVDMWRGPLLAADESVLARCVGPTLDVGCGPGRMVPWVNHVRVPVVWSGLLLLAWFPLVLGSRRATRARRPAATRCSSGRLSSTRDGSRGLDVADLADLVHLPPTDRSDPDCPRPPSPTTPCSPTGTPAPW